MKTQRCIRLTLLLLLGLVSTFLASQAIAEDHSSIADAWVEQPNYIQLSGSGLLEVQHGRTLDQAKTYALQNDQITFFSFITSDIVISNNSLKPGDTFFFTGTPSYIPIQVQSDSYKKYYKVKTEVDAPSGHGFLSLEASMVTPSVVPSNTSYFYLWAGLQPWGLNFQPIGNGVLQPVLTWGAKWAPHHDELPPGYNGWWISGQYVNTQSTYPPFQHVWYGGDPIVANAGDVIKISMVYNSSQQQWVQTVSNQNTNASSTFPFSLVVNGVSQEQNRALFRAEVPSVSTLLQAFSMFDIRLKVANPDSNLGQNLLTQGQCSGVTLSQDKTELSIDRIVIYSPIALP